MKNEGCTIRNSSFFNEFRIKFLQKINFIFILASQIKKYLKFN